VAEQYMEFQVMPLIRTWQCHGANLTR